MKHFVVGFITGAIVMGYHTGYIKVWFGGPNAEPPTPEAAS